MLFHCLAGKRERFHIKNRYGSFCRRSQNGTKAGAFRLYLDPISKKADLRISMSETGGSPDAFALSA